MSQAQPLYRVIDVPNELEGFGTYDHRYPPRPGQFKEESNFADSSGPIFNMYLELAEKEDERMADSWKADADGILVFTGLFSAAVAALISISIQDLRPNSQDTSAFYLQNIYQLLADRNTSVPPTLTRPPAFSPPKYAIWVNSLWFLSLVISLTCALLATLLQQWARRYLKATRTRYSPHKRARIRAFFAEGVEKLHLPWAVEALPALLHVSLFLFFAGLLVFLFNINHSIFNAVVWWVGLCGTVYGCITLMPIFRPDSPYYSPLSSSVWLLHTCIVLVFGRLFATLCIIARFGDMSRLSSDFVYRYYDRLSYGIGKTAESAAFNLSSRIDGRALTWILESLDEDHELERFFNGILGFFKSAVVKNPPNAFKTAGSEKMSEASIGLVGRTWTSNLIDESIKQRRIGIIEQVMAMPSFPISRDAILIAVDDDKMSTSTRSNLVSF
ncbi:hypothetical protein B0F90DRAFT_1938659 [Multifurca ochricompacta]|uniref:DUF6535 domain-containing protein n=1 Tax=Multifurca ochricompacta TaxID=376703 RepID=A0AAD4M191_9AGAM|nr:hypothetical protein B0F90DRAFT_1938659 [Multifurca ochricompacta]